MIKNEQVVTRGLYQVPCQLRKYSRNVLREVSTRLECCVRVGPSWLVV